MRKNGDSLTTRVDKPKKPEKGYLQPLKKMFARREPHTQVNNTDHAHAVHTGIHHTSITV